MKLKTKLALGFSSILVLMSIVIVLLIISLDQQNTNMSEIVKNRYEKYKLATEITDENNAIARQVRDFLLDPETFTPENIENIRQSSLKVASATSSLLRLADRDEEVIQIAYIQDAHRAYVEGVEKAIAYIQEGNLAAAQDVIVSEVKYERQLILDGTAVLRSLEQHEMAEVLAAANDNYRMALRFALLLFAIALTLGILVTVWTVRHLTQSVNRITTAIASVAAGYTDRLPRIDVTSGDEFGKIAGAFNTMAQAIEERTLELQKRARELEQAYAELERTTQALRRAEALAEERNIHLEKIVAQRTQELTRANDKLRLSEKRFRQIFESSPNLMEIRSLKDLSYLDVNESWQHHTGYRLADIKGRRLDLFQPVKDNHLSAPMPDFSQGYPLFSSGLRNARVCYKTRGGELRYGLLSTEIIDLEEEECLLTVITDTTEQHLLEKEMARLDRLNLIGEMAAGIAHEIRNPMTTVRGFLQLLSAREDQTPNREILELMISELDRANAIISEFLSLSKSSPLQLKKQDLNAILESLFPLIQANAFNQEKDVTMELSPLPELELDDREIRQMILNLTRNGLEAMSPGGTLRIGTTTDGQDVVLTVSDQGKGIPDEVLDKLGTPFVTTKENGTGLGLALCYSIAEKHQARIHVETGPQGTTFSVRFPISR